MSGSPSSPSRWAVWRELLVVTLLGLPLITPLVRWSSVPCTHDGHLHYHRVAAIGEAWKQGVFFSRWLPDLAFGYGYPFFVYREPLPLYLTHLFHLTGLPLPAASNLFYILCILAAGWFTFLWVRDIFGAPAGMLAAVAYMAAPYQLIDALIRGNQVESLALALMPLLLWSGRRFMIRGGAPWFLTVTLGLAALALTHNISLLLFTPVLGLYLLAIGWLHRQPVRLVVVRTGLIFLLGLGSTSFYTGSALLEMDQVTLEQSVNRRNNDFRNNFTEIDELLAPVAAEDPTLINPPLPFRIGWAPGLLALLGLASFAWNRQREQRLHLLLAAGGAAIFLMLSLPLAQPLWEALPLIEFVQFPWRLVGRAALPVAMLAGAPLASGLWATTREGKAVIYGRRLPLLLLLGGVILMLVEAIPLLYPNICREEGYPTIADVHTYEATTGLVGVDPEGSYFPRTVEQRPEGSPLLEDYAAGAPPQRLDESQLPAGARFSEVEYRPLGVEAQVESESAFQARYLSFAFPGWTARIDGERVPITPEDPSGLITFAVPPGRHRLSVGWESTPLRTSLGAASLAAFLALLASAVVIHKLSTTRDERRVVWALPRRQMLLVGGVALAVLAAKVLLIDRVDTVLRRPAPPPVGYPTNVQGAELALAGYNLSRDQVAAGETFDVDLAWEVTAPPAAAYQSNLWLVGPEGMVWSDKETFRPRQYEDTPSTLAWAPGQWAWDSREVLVLPGTPPGEYQLVLTLFELETLQPLTLSEDGRVLGPTTAIGQIRVTRPEQPPTLEPQETLDHTIRGLTLLGYRQDRAQAAPGDPLLLTLYWEKREEAEQVPELTLRLEDGTGETAQSWQVPPVRADYPPAEWAEGERLRGPHLLRLPARLESGSYRFVLEDPASPAGVTLGEIEIEAPTRTFVAPPVETPVAETFDDKLILAGYSTTPDQELAAGQPLTVTLVWQGLAEMPVSYRVFVHLIDDDGRIVVQADGEPADWTRPTTGWAPGEYVVDSHRLLLPDPLPEGPLQLRVGLYDAGSGTRLPVGEQEYLLLRP